MLISLQSTIHRTGNGSVFGRGGAGYGIGAWSELGCGGCRALTAGYCIAFDTLRIEIHKSCLKLKAVKMKRDMSSPNLFESVIRTLVSAQKKIVY